MIIEGGVRRRDRRIWYVVLGVFVMVFLFTFLTGRFKSDEEVGAANVSKFDAGYIISDYQMSNYNSMSEAEIQAFLTKKNPCGNTNYGDYAFLSERYPNMKWHFENGHFVCLSEERFGEGVQVGEGDTAAHIIYQAAQDYRINPQVLIVLLEKEQGLITDTFPNSVQYRSATGYGCPDTAACDTEYYGFRNQVRHAAALFRTVLDGGWTNYPLGNNYIQYNPNAACGGSVVNVRNLATSALYRYTPYQPNAGALAAGYGQAYCGAYGNRNFYLYFEDWFGGIQVERGWSPMIIPRVMRVKTESKKINPFDGTVYEDEIVKVGEKYYFDYRINAARSGEKLCLRIAGDTKNNVDKCIMMDNLEETSEELYFVEPISSQKFSILRDTYKYDLKTGEAMQIIKKADFPIVEFAAKVIYNGRTYYQTIANYQSGYNYYVPEEDLERIWSPMIIPRVMRVKTESKKINPFDGTVYEDEIVKVGEKYYFDYRINAARSGEKLCLRIAGDTKNNVDKCIMMDNLEETSEELYFVEPISSQKFSILRDTYKYDLKTGEAMQIIKKADFPIVEFAAKVIYNGRTYYQTIANYQSGYNYYVPEEDLGGAEYGFVDFIVPRKLRASRSTTFVDLKTQRICRSVNVGDVYMYTMKTLVNGESYYRTEEDSKNNSACAVLARDMEEL